MSFANQKRLKAFVLRPKKEDLHSCCDFLTIVLFIICSASLLFLIFNLLQRRYVDPPISETLRMANRVHAKIVKVRDERIAIEGLIYEIRENLDKIYERINVAAVRAKYPLPKQGSKNDGEFCLTNCKKLTRYADSNIISVLCEVGRYKDQFCSTHTKLPVEMVKFFNEQLKAIRLTQAASNGNGHQNITSRNQSDQPGTFFKLIRFPRDANPEESAADEFWFNYVGDPQTSCKVPNKGLKTAEIMCKRWPQSISCNTYCIYGSTYPEGIVRTLNCSYHKNRWSDYFEECQPFVNCKLRLIGPGTLKCIGNQVNQSPSCHIGCEDYEDHDGTPAQMYECKADGTWAPPLPSCVTKKTGVDLVKAPEILEHTSVEYPKMQATK